MRRGINTFDLEAGRVENMEGRMEKDRAGIKFKSVSALTYGCFFISF